MTIFNGSASISWKNWLLELTNNHLTLCELNGYYLSLTIIQQYNGLMVI